MILKDTKYSLKDIMIVPAKISEINSRKECNPRDKWNYLPIFSAPMYGILNQYNWETFNKNGIHSMLPRYREEDWDSYDEYMNMIQQGVWAAISIKDFEDWFCNENGLIGQELACYNICIDTANGHMKRIYHLCDEAKQLAKDYNYELNIMVGNIANPETLKYCWNYKGELIVDYVRLSIGSGVCCFIYGTKITMSDGTYKNIEDIQIGDKVKTIDDTTQEVLNIIKYNSTENLIKINN